MTVPKEDPEVTPTPVMADLRRTFLCARGRYRAGLRFTIGDLLNALGPSGNILAAMILAAPFVSPVTLGPFSIPVCITVIYLGWMTYRGNHKFAFPAKYLAIPLPEKIFKYIRSGAVRFYRWSRWHCLPSDLKDVTLILALRKSSALGVLIAGVLLAMPIPLLPMTNTFPALGVLSFGFAYLHLLRKPFYFGILFSIIGSMIFVGYGILGMKIFFAWMNAGA